MLKNIRSFFTPQRTYDPAKVSAKRPASMQDPLDKASLSYTDDPAGEFIADAAIAGVKTFIGAMAGAFVGSLSGAALGIGAASMMAAPPVGIVLTGIGGLILGGAVGKRVGSALGFYKGVKEFGN